MRRLFTLTLTALILCGAAARSAAPSPPPSAQTILSRILARNPGLATYIARVHVDVRMLSFPFFSPQLDGTAYYKRGKGVLVKFDRLPRYARGLSQFFGEDVDPTAWAAVNNIMYAGEDRYQMRPVYVLRLTRKIYSDQLDHCDAYVDRQTYQVWTMDWYYRNGGSVVLTQTYSDIGDYVLLATQHVEINIPHVHAIADGTYKQFEPNALVNDEVFQTK